MVREFFIPKSKKRRIDTDGHLIVATRASYPASEDKKVIAGRK